MTRLRQAAVFAKRYVALVEALQHEGVPEDIAREEARFAATTLFLAPEYVQPDEPCPACGRRGT